ncbi:MAG TPA: protein kinase [Ktedonobacteraceae bacterium]|nr:protein kinase [Ktedonobacteraceae bacterium]
MAGFTGQPGIGSRWGDYEVTNIVSENTYACVCKAKKILNPDNIVAIKVLNGEKFDAYAMLEREAQVLNLLDHPNIVRYIDFQMTPTGRPYLVLNFVEGKQAIKGSHFKTTLKPIHVRMYVTQIANALQHIHSKEVCHCDIRPQNILITKGDDAILCDFGFALKADKNQPITYEYKDNDDRKKLLPHLDQSYFSSERKEGTIDEKGDQYSLARIVFEWICDDQPLKNGMSIEQRIVAAKYSSEVGKVLEKALNDNMGERYESVKVFSEKLCNALNIDIVNSLTRRPLSTPTKPNSASGSSSATSQSNRSVSASATSSQKTAAEQISHLTHIRRRTILTTLVSLPAAAALPLTWVKLWPRLFQPPPRRSSTRFGTPIGAYLGHRGNVNALAWSPDSQWIASASADNTLQVWKPNSENERIVFPCPDGNVTDVAWSTYKNSGLIAFCAGRYVYIWDFINGTMPYKIPAPRIIKSLAWSPQLLNSSPSLAIAGDHGLVQVLQFDGNDLGQPPTSASYTAPGIKPNTQLSDVAWSSDANNFAVCSKSTSPYVWTWNFNNGLQQTPLMPGLRSGVLSIAWSPESADTLAVGHEGNDPYVQIWSNVFEDGNQPINYHYSGLSRGIDQIAWSPSGLSLTAKTYIAAGAEADGIICVWNTEKKLVPDTYDGHRLSFIDSQRFNNSSIDIKALAWSPDGTMIASGGTDSTVLVWTSGIGTF